MLREVLNFRIETKSPIENVVDEETKKNRKGTVLTFLVANSLALISGLAYQYLDNTQVYNGILNPIAYHSFATYMGFWVYRNNKNEN